MVSFLNINRCLKRAGGAEQPCRLRLRAGGVSSIGAVAPIAGSVTPPRAAGVVLRAADRRALPEMTTEVLDWQCEYTVENVKRDRSSRQPLVLRSGWPCVLRRLWQLAAGRL